MTKKRTDADRRVRQSDRLARVLRLLQLIQGQGNWNALTIAQKLECSERTVYRDLQTLTAAGIPWYFDDFSQSYRLREGYRAQFPKIRSKPGSDQHDSTSNSALTEDARSIATLAKEAAQRLLTEAEGVVEALDRLTKAIEDISGPRTK
jgi:predicted DNA-binding transcriptional regulator YafY